jgi:hypothetical protein
VAAGGARRPWRPPKARAGGNATLAGPGAPVLRSPSQAPVPTERTVSRARLDLSPPRRHLPAHLRPRTPSTTARRPASPLVRDSPNCWYALVNARTRKQGRSCSCSFSCSSRRRHHLVRRLRALLASWRRLSSLLTLRTLVSVPSTCAYPQRRQLSARVVLGLGRKRARTHARLSCLSLLSGPPTCAPTAQGALVSSRRRNGPQARARNHVRTRIPLPVSPDARAPALGSRLVPSFAAAIWDEGKGVQRGVHSMCSPTVRPPSLPSMWRAHTCDLCLAHVPVSATTHPTPHTRGGEKKEVRANACEKEVRKNLSPWDVQQVDQCVRRREPHARCWSRITRLGGGR